MDGELYLEARGGTKPDDDRSTQGWLDDLRFVITPLHQGTRGHEVQRAIWIRVGAVAVRAVESLDRRAR
jgi:hypothetical protein